MKINRIITSTNDNPDYLSFAEFTCKCWKNLGYNVTLNVIGNASIDIDYADIVRWNELPNVKTNKHAQLIRMFNAAMYIDDFCMIADIDMIPLNDSPLVSYSFVPDNHLAQFGYEHPAFQKYPDIGKWPMHGTAAKGSTFKEIVNPNNLNIIELINNWSRDWSLLSKDIRAIPTHDGYFCDESLIKCLIDSWDQDRISKVRREAAGKFNQHPDGGYTVYGRLCRAKHTSLDGINLDEWFEIHGPRPFNEDWYKPVIKYMEKNNVCI